jgi:hypothetical protein
MSTRSSPVCQVEQMSSTAASRQVLVDLMTQLNFDLIQLPENELVLFSTPNPTHLTTGVMATIQIAGVNIFIRLYQK